MTIYPKEFVLLCSDWLRGTEQKKVSFKKFLPLMKENSHETNGYRIWEFEQEELKDVIFNEGDIEITSNPIESCFSLEHNVKMFSGEQQHIDIEKLEDINRLLCMWVADAKIITRWEHSEYFDIYEPLKNAIEHDRDNYTAEEMDLLEGRLKGYKHQSEIFHLGEYDNISSGEILYVMLNTEKHAEYFDDEISSLVYGEMSDYVVFHNDEEFRETFKNNDIYDTFKSFADLFSRTPTETYEQGRLDDILL